MNLPVCLAHWDSRNTFQQYFFVETDDAVFHVRGGTGSSGARWDLGIMIHAFAELHKQGVKITTHTAHYNELNELHLLETFDDFRCMHPMHGCNYHNLGGREETELLVKDICVQKDNFIKGEHNEI
jgi:hypothetical protein